MQDFDDFLSCFAVAFMSTPTTKTDYWDSKKTTDDVFVFQWLLACTNHVRNPYRKLLANGHVILFNLIKADLCPITAGGDDFTFYNLVWSTCSLLEPAPAPAGLIRIEFLNVDQGWTHYKPADLSDTTTTPTSIIPLSFALNTFSAPSGQLFSLSWYSLGSFWELDPDGLTLIWLTAWLQTSSICFPLLRSFLFPLHIPILPLCHIVIHDLLHSPVADHI